MSLATTTSGTVSLLRALLRPQRGIPSWGAQYHTLVSSSHAPGPSSVQRYRGSDLGRCGPRSLSRLTHRRAVSLSAPEVRIPCGYRQIPTADMGKTDTSALTWVTLTRECILLSRMLSDSG
ncbi:hypothetical protein NDU88_002568 [Pleurodeles waltl]|uniref:Uncharacterized protein n=1 Tax=Pleurodeles waltl TaxID=8319 RepID=A0AAV7UB87_PLEWA|nr:hypothetical protein NDU88_002568 [Pleurodeles waltl]